MDCLGFSHVDWKYFKSLCCCPVTIVGHSSRKPSFQLLPGWLMAACAPSPPGPSTTSFPLQAGILPTVPLTPPSSPNYISLPWTPLCERARPCPCKLCRIPPNMVPAQIMSTLFSVAIPDYRSNVSIQCFVLLIDVCPFTPSSLNFKLCDTRSPTFLLLS